MDSPTLVDKIDELLRFTPQFVIVSGVLASAMVTLPFRFAAEYSRALYHFEFFKTVVAYVQSINPCATPSALVFIRHCIHPPIQDICLYTILPS